MGITELGYLGVHSDKTSDWSDFARNLLGMQQIDQGGGALSFRMDDRKQRFLISGMAGDQLAFMGWEVERPEDLEIFASRLDAADVEVTLASRDLADQRFVRNLIYFDDPAGNRIELFHGAHIDSDPFVPGRRHSGFKTGPYGLGHAVLHVTDAKALVPFYCDILGFQLSDFGLDPYPLYFFHVNGRHHSFALVGSGHAGFHHFMVEFNSLDDVGQGYDLAQARQDGIGYTLGRHTNDWMTSFYANSPSGFFVENGWGGRIIDPETWIANETNAGPSYWGHDRLHLSQELQDEFKLMRMKLAAEGQQTPPLIDCPWLYQQLRS